LSASPSPASTLACGGAPATVKPGIGPASALTGTALTAILGLFGAAEAGVIFDVVLAGVNFDLFQICNGGDPGDVTLTVQDYADALNVAVPSVNLPAVAKFHQWIAHAMFAQWCNCADGTSPPTPTPSIPPPYVPNPGAPSGVPTPPCWNVQQVLMPIAPPQAHEITNIMLPATTVVSITPSESPGPTTARLITGGVTTVTSHVVLTQHSGVDQLAVELDTFNASGVFVGRMLMYDNSLQAGTDQSYTFPLPANAYSWNIWYEFDNPTGDSVEITLQFNCTGTNTPTLNTPCCPPDPTVDIRLRSIQDMLQFLMDQTKPSYTAGTVHTGLTGAGTLAISNLVGVKIDITSGVPTNPQLPGTPPYEFSVGWMSVSEPNGMLDEKRITRQHQVWLSGVTPYATVFGYYLNPGFTINVTELIPA
jgi:hypothetical protein